MSDDAVEKALAGGTKFRAYRDEDEKENIKRYDPAKDNKLGIERILQIDSDNGHSALSIHAGGNGSKDYLIETVNGLLTQGGLSAKLEDKSGGGGARLKFTLNGEIGSDSLAKLALALSQEAPKGKSDRHYPVISPETANAIIGNELEVQGKKPSELGMINLQTTVIDGQSQQSYGLEKPWRYIGATIQYPHAAITSVTELAFPTSNSSGANVIDIETRIDTKSPQLVQAALRAAGIKIGSDSKDDYIIAEAPADIATQALRSKPGLIPDFIAAEIQQAASEAHPDQMEVNASVRSSSDQLVQKVTGKAPATGGRTD